MKEAAAAKLSPAETWVDNYADYLYSYALYRVADVETAEDLVQETFAAALKGRKGYRGESSEKTWLTSILRNKILDLFRKRYREGTRQLEDPDRFPADQYFDNHDNWSVKPQKWQLNPYSSLETSEFMEIIHACLETLSPTQADAFRLREFDQADTEEICKVLNISATNFWVLMHRARLFMRRCLEVKWFNPETGAGRK